jgi:hypothetical protein
MQKLIRARYLAPAIHALLFFTTTVIYWLSSEAFGSGPARVPFGILLIADLPISLPTIEVMLTSAKYGSFAWAAWGILGTGWWYLIGIAIEAKARRDSKTSTK